MGITPNTNCGRILQPKIGVLKPIKQTKRISTPVGLPLKKDCLPKKQYLQTEKNMAAQRNEIASQRPDIKEV